MVAGKNECLIEVECPQRVFVLFKLKKGAGEEHSNHANTLNNLDWAETSMQPKINCVIIFALKFYTFLPPHYAKHTFRDTIKIRIIPNLHDVLRTCYMCSEILYHVLLFNVLYIWSVFPSL